MSVKHALTADGSPLVEAADWNASHTVDDGSFVAAKLSATATDKVFGRSSSGAGNGEEIALTAAGRALIDDADAAAQRTTLGIATAITGTALDTLAATTDITTRNASTSAHGLLRKLDNDSSHFLDGTGAWSTPAGSGTPARTEAVLSADVTMTTANTEYDGPTSTPAAGVYDVTAYAMIGTGTANVITAIVGRLKYGSTVVDERQGHEYVGNDFGYPVTIPLSARVTADGSTAIKISATTDRAGAVIMRDPFNNSSGVHRGTLLVLIKVG